MGEFFLNQFDGLQGGCRPPAPPHLAWREQVSGRAVSAVSARAVSMARRVPGPWAVGPWPWERAGEAGALGFSGWGGAPASAPGGRGLGDATQVIAQGAAQTVQAASGGLQTLALSAPTIAGSVLTAGGTSSIAAAIGLSVPVVGAAVAGITLALSLIFARKGPKQKQATTAIVDKVEPLLQQNVEGYLSGPRTVSSQQQAIQNFYAGWQYVLDYCGAAAMGTPGQNCISERQEGAHPQWDACKPNCPNWFQLYLDPIRNDPDVQPDPGTGTGAVSMIEGLAGGHGLLLLAGAAVLLAFGLGGSK